MPFVDEILGAKRPAAVHSVNLPRREGFLPSPADWRDEVLYFMLPDRFSDELSRPLLDRNDLNDAQNADPRGLAMGQLGDSMTVILNMAEAAEPGFTGTHPVGSVLPVRRRPDGSAFVELRNISPSDVLVLTNHP